MASVWSMWFAAYCTCVVYTHPRAYCMYSTVECFADCQKVHACVHSGILECPQLEETPPGIIYESGSSGRRKKEKGGAVVSSYRRPPKLKILCCTSSARIFDSRSGQKENIASTEANLRRQTGPGHIMKCPPISSSICDVYATFDCHIIAHGPNRFTSCIFSRTTSNRPPLTCTPWPPWDEPTVYFACAPVAAVGAFSQ